MTNWEIPRMQADPAEDLEQDEASEQAFNRAYNQTSNGDIAINMPEVGDSEFIDLTVPQKSQNSEIV